MSNLDAKLQVLTVKFEQNWRQSEIFKCRQKAENKEEHSVFENMKSKGFNTKQEEAKLKMFEVQKKAMLNEINSVNKLIEKESIFG